MIFFLNIPFASFFFLFPLLMFFAIAGTTKILMFDLVMAHDSATHNWSCENTGSGKYTDLDFFLDRAGVVALLFIAEEVFSLRPIIKII
jgi:hypothetical protein